mgnify:CR=1 FL=1
MQKKTIKCYERIIRDLLLGDILTEKQKVRFAELNNLQVIDDIGNPIPLTIRHIREISVREGLQ